ncbi:hypothetical protein [Natronomonas sp. CBA1123]|jgi:hypothetical protein|uniref:hypothetical protein n=1 Tax=Natronomonas sp. CBA1123 TaxID=2668070 RepID=UPI0018D22831|nr:hypothetical protein [Natronomonas sp. CBA1123]
MTEDTDMTDDDTPETLGEMSHTNPITGEVFGSTQTYSRGKTVAADGGEANAVSRPSSESSDGGEANAVPDETETLGDVSHTPPGDSDGAQRAYDRGVNDE